MDEDKDDYQFRRQGNTKRLDMTGSEISIFDKDLYQPIDTTQDDFMSAKYLKTKSKKQGITREGTSVTFARKARRSKKPDDKSYIFGNNNNNNDDDASATEPFIMEPTSYVDAVCEVDQRRNEPSNESSQSEEGEESSSSTTSSLTVTEDIAVSDLHAMTTKLQMDLQVEKERTEKVRAELEDKKHTIE